MFKRDLYPLRPMNRLTDETGAAALIALFISLILLTVAASYMGFTVSEYGISKSEVHAQKVLEIAEAGMDAARMRIPWAASSGTSTFGNLTGTNFASMSPQTITFEGFGAIRWQPISYANGKYQITVQNDVRPGDAEFGMNPYNDTNGVVYVISKALIPFGNFTTFSGANQGIVRVTEVKGSYETVWKHVVSTPNNPTYTTTGGSTTLTYTPPATASANGPKQFNSLMFPTPDLNCYQTLATTSPGTLVGCARVNSIGGVFITINPVTNLITVLETDVTPTVSYGGNSYFITSGGTSLNPSATISYTSTGGQAQTVTIDKAGGNSVTYHGVIYIKFSGTNSTCTNCLVELKNDVTLNGVLIVENGKVKFSGRTFIIPPLTTGGSCGTQRFPALIVYDTDPTGTSSYPNYPAPNPASCTSGTIMVDAGNQNLRICGVTFTNGAVAANPYNLGVNPPCDPNSGGGNIITTGCLNTQGSTTLNYTSNIGTCPPPGFSVSGYISKQPGTWREVHMNE